MVIVEEFIKSFVRKISMLGSTEPKNVMFRTSLYSRASSSVQTTD